MLKILIDYPAEDTEAEILDKVHAGFDSGDLTTAHLQPVLIGKKSPARQRNSRWIYGNMSAMSFWPCGA